MRLLGIEAGGTKFVCVTGNEHGTVFAREQFPTETPEITLAKVRAFIKTHRQEAALDAIGIASFGPIDPDPRSLSYGSITSTPKLAWRQCQIVDLIKQACDVPIGFDTDVNAALLGEYYWGNGRGLKDFIYLTIGTGIGGGVMVEGKLLHGAMHPEMGHLLIPHDYQYDPFPGVCPYHGNCLEGLASGPALKERWQVTSALDLPQDHPAWEIESGYLATALSNYILCFSPERIILGGGVMKQTHLLPMIQQKVVALLKGYIRNHTIENISDTIVIAALQQQAGSVGALALARQSLAV